MDTVKRDRDAYPYRRHLKTCEYFGRGGRDIRLDKCLCPFHVDGSHNGERIRQSLNTSSRQLADRRLAELIRTLDAQVDEQQGIETQVQAGLIATRSGTVKRTVSEAVERFLASHGEILQDGKYRGDSEYNTFRKYRSGLRFLVSFCDGEGVSALPDVSTDLLEDFRSTRKIGLVAWRVERQALCTFFGYCLRRGWITINPAKELRAPRNVKPNEVVPYTLHEESLILAACEQIGGGRCLRPGATYERLRARAMVLLLRHTALRVSDVCTLRKDAVSYDRESKVWRLLLRTQKSGEPVYLPIPETLQLALEILPLPRNAPRDCPYFFWNGQASRRAVVGIAERSLSAVFKKSGVKDAHAHRFRHTLATRLLAQSATFEQVADILGNSPEVVRKHYGKWSKGRQDNIDRLMFAHFESASFTVPVTNLSHEKTGAVN